MKSSIAHTAATGGQQLKAYSNGVVKIGMALYSVTKWIGGQIVSAAWDPGGIVLAGPDDVLIAEYAWAPPGIKYVGMGQARVRFRR